MSKAGLRRRWIRWWRYEQRCNKVTGHVKDPLWPAMVEVWGRGRFNVPRWLR